MGRPRGYRAAYGNEALAQLRAWQSISGSELAQQVQAAGGQLSSQHVRNIESRGASRVYPSHTLLTHILTALHADEETLERVRQDIERGHGQAGAPSHSNIAVLPAKREEVIASALLADEERELAGASSLPSPQRLAAPAASSTFATFGARMVPEENAPTWSQPVETNTVPAPEQGHFFNNADAPSRLRGSRLSAPASAQSLSAVTPRPRIEVAAPPAPSPAEASHEFNAIYRQLDDARRHNALGRLRQLQTDARRDAAGR